MKAGFLFTERVCEGRNANQTYNRQEVAGWTSPPRKPKDLGRRHPITGKRAIQVPTSSQPPCHQIVSRIDCQLKHIKLDYRTLVIRIRCIRTTCRPHKLAASIRKFAKCV